jgi:hypothetical protein
MLYDDGDDDYLGIVLKDGWSAINHSLNLIRLAVYDLVINE